METQFFVMADNLPVAHAPSQDVMHDLFVGLQAEFRGLNVSGLSRTNRSGCVELLAKLQAVQDGKHGEQLRAVCLAASRMMRQIEALDPPAASPVTEPPQAAAAVDDSAWVKASTLWPVKIKTRRKLNEFRADHPEMFRNPTRNILKIHAAKWATFWAARGKAAFASLDGELPSLADDPDVQDGAIAEAMQRAEAARAKKKARKQ